MSNKPIAFKLIFNRKNELDESGKALIQIRAYNRYSENVDQEIPWQREQLISWRKIAISAVVAISKLIILSDYRLLILRFG